MIPSWFKRLVWLYFILLIFEGALRKWWLPALSTPLLVVRDPIVVILYIGALRLHLFPKDRITNFALILGVACTLITMVMSVHANTAVAIFGFRSNFGFIPLIFLLPKILDWNDLIKIGRVFLWLSIPMALLMTYQYREEATAWINKGVGEGMLLSSALGKIRPSGTFSFSTGPIAFFAIVLAFVLGGYTDRKSVV